jgi:hypothetical protein
MDTERRIPNFGIEDAGTGRPESDDLDAALAEARGGGKPCGRNPIRTGDALGGRFCAVYRRLERISPHEVSTK